MRPAILRKFRLSGAQRVEPVARLLDEFDVLAIIGDVLAAVPGQHDAIADVQRSDADGLEQAREEMGFRGRHFRAYRLSA